MVCEYLHEHIPNSSVRVKSRVRSCIDTFRSTRRRVWRFLEITFGGEDGLSLDSANAWLGTAGTDKLPKIGISLEGDRLPVLFRYAHEHGGSGFSLWLEVPCEGLGCSVIPWPGLKGDIQPRPTGANDFPEGAQFIAVIVGVFIATDSRGRGSDSLCNLCLREPCLLT